MSLHQPTYQLEDVCIAARKGNITFRGRSETDVHNLGYSFDDVANCLCSLNPVDYVKTEKLTINGRDGLYDVYVTNFTTKDGQRDELYIKLKLSGWILIASFHQPR